VRGLGFGHGTPCAAHRVPKFCLPLRLVRYEVYRCVCGWLRPCVCVCACVCVCSNLCACLCVCHTHAISLVRVYSAHVHTHTHTFKHMHTRTHTDTHTHTHTHRRTDRQTDRHTHNIVYWNSYAVGRGNCALLRIADDFVSHR
jgi:hypothetical protein